MANETCTQNDEIKNSEPWGLPLKFKILPEYFKDLGYTTHAIGKWHLGFFRKEYTPLMRGFDHHFGFWTSHHGYYDHCSHETYAVDGKTLSSWGLDLRRDFSVVSDRAGHYSTTLFTDEAVDVIRSHNDSKPLLLYISHQAVHVGNYYHPLEAPAEHVKKFDHIRDMGRRMHAAMVSALDESVGRVFEALRKRRVLEDTVVAFLSSGGGDAFEPAAGSNWPLRGSKGSLWEGGTRTAALLWSTKVTRPRVATQLAHVTDWLPTLYSAAGGDITDLGAIDGKDLWTVLVDDRPSPRTEILYNINYQWKLAAIRIGWYKLVLGASPEDQHDGWYETRDTGSEHGRQTPPGTDADSAVHRALRAMGRGGGTSRHPDNPLVTVHCGLRQPDTSPADACQPRRKPCLFDLQADPCEYRNVAAQQKKVLARLFYRLQELQASGKPPLNRAPSAAANPALHCNVWVPFMDGEIYGRAFQGQRQGGRRYPS
ncbi:arylsulfatase B-like [Dermacentor variabilis]|uniref:arylsulfatase B-like n=1 Tax=Dermacentor variabilis TaxID=34621 RepID=UPI003F5B34CA